MFRMIKQVHVTQVHGYIPVSDSYYILQVSRDDGEHWETVPIIRWDDLSESEQTKIERELLG